MTDAPTPEQLTTDQRVGHYLDLWKKAVDVQQHFNDIEFRIRGLALTVATFALGAGAVAARDGASVGPVSLGAAVTVLGLMLWQAFYFVDRYWYHPLLKAAVHQGTRFEDALKPDLEHAAMTAAITAASPTAVKGFFGIFVPRKVRRSDDKKLHSDDKIAVFYRIGSTVFLVAAVAFQLGTLFERPIEDPASVVIDDRAPAAPAPEPTPSTAPTPDEQTTVPTPAVPDTTP